MFGTDGSPLHGEEHHARRRDEPPKRPSASEPVAPPETGILCSVVFFGLDIHEKSVTDVCTGVPLKHRID